LKGWESNAGEIMEGDEGTKVIKEMKKGAWNEDTKEIISLSLLEENKETFTLLLGALKKNKANDNSEKLDCILS
jgi:hypothetical protein